MDSHGVFVELEFTRREHGRRRRLRRGWVCCAAAAGPACGARAACGAFCVAGSLGLDPPCRLPAPAAPPPPPPPQQLELQVGQAGFAQGRPKERVHVLRHARPHAGAGQREARQSRAPDAGPYSLGLPALTPAPSAAAAAAEGCSAPPPLAPANWRASARTATKVARRGRARGRRFRPCTKWRCEEGSRKTNGQTKDRRWRRGEFRRDGTCFHNISVQGKRSEGQQVWDRT